MRPATQPSIGRNKKRTCPPVNSGGRHTSSWVGTIDDGNQSTHLPITHPPKPTCEPTNINQTQTTKQNQQYSLVPKKSQQNQYSPFALRVGSGSQNESYWIVRVDPSHHWHVEHCSPLHEMLIAVAWTCLPHFITLELDKTGPIQHNGRTSCM